MNATHTRSASLVGSVKDWLELMISFLVQESACLAGRFTDYEAADRTCVDYIIKPFRDHHVHLRVSLDRTSIYRVITSFLLFFRDARVSEAENSLGLKKKMARISLRRVEARQYPSIRSGRRIITRFPLFFFN